MNVHDHDKNDNYLNERSLRVYQELLGSYNWLANISRPEIAYSMSKFRSYTKKSTETDLMQLKKLLAYIRNTQDWSIIITKKYCSDNNVKLYAFSDASFASEENRKSRIGFIVYANGTPIFWKSKKQSLVMTSTFEAEYMVLSTTVNEIIWTVNLFKQFGIQTVEIPKILEDNNGVVLTTNGTGSGPSKNKHVNIKEMHVQDRVKRGEAIIEYVPTENNIAHALTKPLQSTAFYRHLPFLGFDENHHIRSITWSITLGKYNSESGNLSDMIQGSVNEYLACTDLRYFVDMLYADL